ncbi:MAG: 4-alpha-glucanotransferase [Acidimicrobiia bacterium]
MPGSPLSRSGGILLHPTSLPGTGIGDTGPSAHRFAGVVAEMGLRWWQMLPIGPTGYGDSPYQSPSTFAGNPLLISLDDLAQDGLLDPSEIEADFPTAEVDFGAVIPWKRELLDRAAQRFSARPAPASFDQFLDTHMDTWLDDFSVFTALKRAHALRPWWEWEGDIRRRRPAALRRATAELTESILTVKIEQYVFDRGFRLLRSRCQDLGISLIGDIPIFVAHDSADVWANPSLFHLDGQGNPTVVAGVPPDYFSATGQRWGNPLYDWDRHVETGFAWWTDRMRRMFDLFDLVRIDHFRGFSASWHIPADEPTAENGEWVAAPGKELFAHLKSVFGNLPVIAEDLGLITPEVEELRDEFGLPGMKVLQFGFGTESAHAIDQFREHVVAYTGTHDNDTARGWFDSDEPTRIAERDIAMTALGSDGSDFASDLIDGVFESVAAIAIAPLQDVLSLDSNARMNTPGVEAGNWRWRFTWDQVTPEVVEGMARTVCRTHRV